MTTFEEDEQKTTNNPWIHGFPPDDDVTKWEVYFAPLAVWHRRKEDSKEF